MDALNGWWVSVEKRLYAQAFAQPVSLVLYDLGSLYFEGGGPEQLAQYGYRRDHREGRRQILLAVATDSQGIPIHLELLRGNRADMTTLRALLLTLQRRFGIKEAVFVFDNGMSSSFNLEAMREAHLDFVTRLSAASLREVLQQLPTESQPQLWDWTTLVDLTLDGRRYVIAGGEYRQQRDLARRTARLEKAEKELKRLAAVRRKKTHAQKLVSQAGRALQRLKAHKYFQYWVDQDGKLQFHRNEQLNPSRAAARWSLPFAHQPRASPVK